MIVREFSEGPAEADAPRHWYQPPVPRPWQPERFVYPPTWWDGDERLAESGDSGSDLDDSLPHEGRTAEIAPRMKSDRHVPEDGGKVTDAGDAVGGRPQQTVNFVRQSRTRSRDVPSVSPPPQKLPAVDVPVTGPQPRRTSQRPVAGPIAGHPPSEQPGPTLDRPKIKTTPAPPDARREKRSADAVAGASAETLGDAGSESRRLGETPLGPAEVAPPVETARDQPPLEQLLDRITDAHAHAVCELAGAPPDLRRVFDEQLTRVVNLVERARQLPAVRANSGLLAELSELDGEGPREFLDVLAVVLTEAYGEDRLAAFNVRAPAPDAEPRTIHGLIRSAEEAIRQLEQDPRERAVTVGVAPAADGTIDGKLSERPASRLEIRDSIGVACGNDNEVEVVHLCEVDEPIVEIAELLAIDTDGDPVFGFTTWALRSEPSPRLEAETSTVRTDAWTAVRQCVGVSVGDHMSINVTRHYRIGDCRVNAQALLQDDEVRAALAACHDDPDNQAARDRLAAAARRAAAATDVSDLVSEEDVARVAANSARPTIRHRGGRLVISHGTGVAVGHGWRVSAQRRFEAGGVRVQ